MEGFLRILGIYSAQPTGGHPFTLETADTACLALRGERVREQKSDFILDVGEVEAEGLTRLSVDVENIGLDEAMVSVAHTDSILSARFSSEVVPLKTGGCAALEVGITGPGQPGLAVEGEILLQVRRADRLYDFPVMVRAETARIAAVPRFLFQGDPCPGEYDFGRVETRELIADGPGQNSASIFRCTVENMGSRSCLFSVVLEGEGFEVALAQSAGKNAAEIPPRGNVDVLVKPSMTPVGPRRALLRMIVEGTREGVVSVPIRLAADVHASGPLFMLEPGLERVKAFRGCRGILPVKAANLGTESIRIKVVPRSGTRNLKETLIDLPASDGVTPAAVEAFVNLDTEGFAPGEHTLQIAVEAAGDGPLSPLGEVILLVDAIVLEPHTLNFGTIPLGETAEKEVCVHIPSDLAVTAAVVEELAGVLSVEVREAGRLTVRVHNNMEAPDEPRQGSGVGVDISVPAIPFTCALPVSFQRLRPVLAVPGELEFGSGCPGQSVHLVVPISNEGEADLKLWASAADAVKITLAPDGEMVVPAHGKQQLSVDLILPDGEPGNPRSVAYATAIHLKMDVPQVSRSILIRGTIVPAFRQCLICTAITGDLQAQFCWFCGGALVNAPRVAVDAVGKCSRCGGLFPTDYTFCPKEGGDLLPFAESS
jgi:hypothetical protein